MWSDAIEYNREQEYPRSTWRRVQHLIGATPDGIVGPETCRLLADWQRSVGLDADGCLGPATRTIMSQELREVRTLNDEERARCMEFTGRHEGGRWDSMNRDGEYEGWFDSPKRDEGGDFLAPHERAQRPDHKPHWASKYGPNPGHVGLSYGKHQTTQKAGTLGLVVKRAQELAGEAAFAAVFGAHADELVYVLNLGDDPFVDRFGDGRRGPNTVPVGGHDVWERYWTERFKEASGHGWMQQAQVEVFVSQYWEPMMRTARRLGFFGQDELAVLYDFAIQYGPGGMRKRVRRAEEKWGDDVTIEDIINEFPAARRARRWSIIERSEWWVRYTEEETC